MALRKRPVLACGVQFARQLQEGMSVTEIPDIARRVGVDGVEFREVYWKDKAAELPVVRDRMQALGLTTTYATFTTLINQDPARRELLLELDAAGEDGAPTQGHHFTPGLGASRAGRGSRAAGGPARAGARPAAPGRRWRSGTPPRRG